MGTNIHSTQTDDQKHMPFGYDTQTDWDDSRVRVAYLSLSSAQILALNSTPLDIVAAPGANKFIEPVSVFAKYTHVTTAYTFGGSIQIRLSGVAIELSLGSTIITTASDYYRKVADPASIGNSSDITNTKNILYASSAPTGGDGTLEVWYHYRVIDLTIS